MMSISYYEKDFYTSFRCYKLLASYQRFSMAEITAKSVVTPRVIPINLHTSRAPTPVTKALIILADRNTVA